MHEAHGALCNAAFHLGVIRYHLYVFNPCMGRLRRSLVIGSLSYPLHAKRIGF